jgi:uncharacterized repeat protein (TIGR01451 family)
MPGGHIDWFMGVRNDGDTAATGVIARVAIPAGLVYIVGSLSNYDPAAAVAEFSNNGGTSWTYVPKAASGEPDPNVTDVRLVRASVASGTDGRAIVSTEAQFREGTFADTWFDIGRGIRVDGSSGKSTGSYTTRAIPFAQEGAPTAWKSITVSEQTNTGVDDISYDIIDAKTNLAVPGFSNLQPTGGSINISALSTSSYPQIKVRANLTADASEACFQEVLDQSDPKATCSPDLLGINNSDVVFGNLWRGGAGCKERGFRWTETGGMTVLQSLGGNASSLISYAYAQNDSGVIVGESLTSGLQSTHAVRWPANSSVPEDLHGALGATVDSWATAISPSGKIGGMLGGSAAGPVRWISGSAETVDSNDLPANATWDWRVLINDAGDVAGRFKPELTDVWHAFLWKADGTFVDIGAPGDVAHLTGLNDDGWIVGYGDIARDAWLYRPGQPVLAFSSLVPNGRFFVANGVNDNGKVVGSYVDATDSRRAFAWTASGGLTSVDAGTWKNSEALGVNTAGNVLVVGYDSTKPLPPFANVGFNTGGATTFKPMPGPIPEVWGNRLAHEGYRTFNDSLKLIGYYTTTDIVGGAPAEVPYFSGECGDGTPSLASIGATYESPMGEVVSFQTLYSGAVCAESQVGQANLSADVDSNLTNNVAVAPLRLSRPDVGVAITRPENYGGVMGSWNSEQDWNVTITNYSQATVSGVKLKLSVPPTFTLLDQYYSTLGPARTLIIGNLAPGASTTRAVKAQDLDYIVTSSSVTLSASVEADNDCVTDNNTASSTVAYGDGPNLFVASTATPVVNTGGILTYTVQFGNNGTQPFTGRATLKVSVGNLALTSGALSETWDTGLVFATGMKTAEYVFDGTQTAWEPNVMRTLTLTVAAPDCIAASSGFVTSSATWTVTDGNATDNATQVRSLLVGEPTDDPTLCAPVCETDADCPVQDSVCAGTAVCLGSLGCAYNDLALNADVDATYCTVNERCVNGAVVTDERTCQVYCAAEALGAVCDPDKDACVDVYAPDVADRDFDGMPDVCDECAVDFYECDGANNAIYSLVQDASGKPVGSVRCVRNRDTDEVVCDTKPGTTELVVYPDLVCGGTDAAKKAN